MTSIARIKSKSPRTPRPAEAATPSRLAPALALAAEGWPVFPIYPIEDDGRCGCEHFKEENPGESGPRTCAPGKHPFTIRGHNDASTDPAQIRAWWEDGGPDWNIGIAIPAGVVVVDVDPRNGGEATFAKMCDEHGESWLDSRVAETGGGGFQVYLACEPDRRFPKNLDRHFGPGVDLKQHGGYVLAPPSNHKSGGVYSWMNEGPLAPAPAWLTLLSTVREPAADAPALAVPDVDELDADLRERLDKAIEAIEPFYALGSRHELAVALGVYFKKNKVPKLGARYVVSNLPSDNPAARVNDALWAYEPGVKGRGAATLRESYPDLLDELDALELDGYTRRWRERRAKRRAEGASAGDDDGAPGVLSGRDPAVDNVIANLAAPRVGVFQRSGKLVVVTREARHDGDIIRADGAPTIRELVPARLREIIRTTAGPRDAPLAAEVLARGEWAGIRPLDAIVSFPVMRRDGSLLLTSGYDAATRTLAEIPRGLVDVPGAPTRADARTALALLTDLVSDFPFAGEAQRAAWLAMLLTVPARPAIDGPTPLGLLEATQRGSGKTLLADAISWIVTGAEASRRVAPKTREEWDKVLFSILLAGDPLVLFDNVTTMLSSDALDAVLTGTTYAQRLLGVSEERRVAIRTVFLASANNARLSTDLVRRSVGCRLEPDVERPEERAGFKHADLLGHVRRERGRYLGAALTILRAYAVAGRPTVKARPMGSYTAWCRVVRDALVWAGATDPAITQDALRETADVERDELRDLLTAWHGLLGDRAVTVRELLDAAYNGRIPGDEPAPRAGGKFARVPAAGPAAGAELLDALRGVTPGEREPTPHTIGNRLRTLRGQIVGGLVLQEGKANRDKVRVWTVRQL